MDAEAIERYEAEAERLNNMQDEVVSFNLQGAESADHILAAEALLAFYEQSVKVQIDLAFEAGQTIDDEGSLKFYRVAAELHLQIAQAMSDQQMANAMSS